MLLLQTPHALHMNTQSHLTPPPSPQEYPNKHSPPISLSPNECISHALRWTQPSYTPPFHLGTRSGCPVLVMRCLPHCVSMDPDTFAVVRSQAPPVCCLASIPKAQRWNGALSFLHKVSRVTALNLRTEKGLSSSDQKFVISHKKYVNCSSFSWEDACRHHSKPRVVFLGILPQRFSA